jgi:hypothetical protein
MVKDTEQSIRRRRCELFQPLHNYHPTISNVDAHGEYVETIENESGIKTSEVRHRYKVLEGRQMNGFVQGRLEDPGDAP